MSETLILAAIIAPLMFVPAIIVSFMSHVDGLSWPHTEFLLPTEAESRFAQFHREMIEQMCRALAIPKEILAEPCEPSGYSMFAESIRLSSAYRKRRAWL